MKFKTEIVDEKQKVLILSKKNYSFIIFFKKKLKKFNVEFYFSTVEPKNFLDLNYVVVIDLIIAKNKIEQSKDTKFIFIFTNNKLPDIFKKQQPENVKIVLANSHYLNESDIDNIFWFGFSRSQEKILRLFTIPAKKNELKKNYFVFFYKYLTKKNLFLMLLIGFFLFNILFFPFLFLSTFFTYQSYSSFKKQNYLLFEKNLKLATELNQIAKDFYRQPRTIYLMFSLASFIDDFFLLNSNSIEALNQIKNLADSSKQIQELIFVKNKSDNQKENLKLVLNKMNDSLNKLSVNLEIINQKLNWTFYRKNRDEFLELADFLNKSKNIFSYFKKILLSEKESKFLIFFANNMELRPGGGFLGSLAIATIGNYRMDELRIYDIYDIDGQLRVHLDPPKPLVKYLSLPHWFLRDSNFSPDFYENYQKALFFIEKTLNLKDFQGSILLTTTAVENILKAFGDIYLPDYKEYINAKNFYIKTQLNVEKNFFPGSRQKQVFLSSLVRQVFVQLPKASSIVLLKSLKQSLDEKQIVMYFDDSQIQSVIDNAFWSGRITEPKCLLDLQNCIIDYIFPYDANVGANKANFFINRSFYLKTYLDSFNKINHLLSIQYQNNSPAEVFPTGYYRNYFQVMLPVDSAIKSITKDGALIEDYDQTDYQFKKIGFYFEVPPKKIVEIKINYYLNTPFLKGRQIYQLITQKQIGALNSDFILDFNFNKNISVLNKNFSPLVKDDSLVYNTNLSADKLFLMELLNE